ncbi:MAG: hypothetical protein JWO35_369 [Candidatus Saccharibacteria bacterium]|nr:hypothetical protein [Candidatus Saccharibacteria bacterium]
MKCPVCKQEMKKVRWEITSNLKPADSYKEYDKTKYECKDDEVMVITEIPIVKTVEPEQPK